MSVQNRNISSVVLRLGLGLGFLSAVADRFGLWGPFGERNVEWGNYSRFLDYTQTLNGFWPASLIPTLGAVATGAEILFGLLILRRLAYTHCRTAQWRSTHRVRHDNDDFAGSQVGPELRRSHRDRRIFLAGKL